jgi:protein-tyrosine phosphatase
VELRSRARQFLAEDFGRFDYVLAMDRENRDELLSLAPDETARARVHLLRSFDSGSRKGVDVPDPYYGGERGFDDVFEICEAGCRGLLERLIEDHSLGEG